MTQFFIALFGFTAMALALDDKSAYHQYAAWFGLAAQPFWLRATWRKWGMFALSIGYSALYIRAVCA